MTPSPPFVDSNPSTANYLGPLLRPRIKFSEEENIKKNIRALILGYLEEKMGYDFYESIPEPIFCELNKRIHEFVQEFFAEKDVYKYKIDFKQIDLLVSKLLEEFRGKIRGVFLPIPPPIPYDSSVGKGQKERRI